MSVICKKIFEVEIVLLRTLWVKRNAGRGTPAKYLFRFKGCRSDPALFLRVCGGHLLRRRNGRGRYVIGRQYFYLDSKEICKLRTNPQIEGQLKHTAWYMQKTAYAGRFLRPLKNGTNFIPRCVMVNLK